MMRVFRQMALAVVLSGILTGPALSAEIERLPAPVVLSQPLSKLPETACTLRNHGDTIINYYSGIAVGERYATYIDPANCAGSPKFPFKITAVPLALFTFGAVVWPLKVDVEIWSVKGGDKCQGPGAILYTEPRTLDQATFSIPNVGTITLAQPVCVDGPFYISIRYTGQSSPPFPSVVFDNHTNADSCINWGYGPTTDWDKWNQFWNPPLPGNLVIWVQGETNAASCGNPLCCTGNTGNVDCDAQNQTDISDLTRLIDYLYVSFQPLCCAGEANIDGSAGIDISDLSRLIDYLYITFTLPAQCQ